MPVCVAEYLGQRTDSDQREITPAKSPAKCPFMNTDCSKLKQGNKPVCSIRKPNGQLWIVCRNRLCSTKKDIFLNSHQTKILREVAKVVFPQNVDLSKIFVRQETPIKFSNSSRRRSMADYIMRLPEGKTSSGPTKLVLEMQGGGETSNTGKLTKHVDYWENSGHFLAETLSEMVDGVNTLETNAWRRQQEQFLVKGNIAIQSGGGMAFCVGPLLYDLLMEKVTKANLNDLKKHAWTLALISFREKKVENIKPGPIELEIDPKRILFTNYHAFVRALTDQGEPSSEIFTGEFVSLIGERVSV